MYKLEVRDRIQTKVLAIQKGLVVPELLIKLDILKFQSIYCYLSGNAVVLSLNLV
ncbi:hypothetical protein [uncultured Nostoc sp.]|uniref:hypothetical protein n=1 Tax=uncultured Nostoc sp. TaxID=340711 RepID=UPI0035CC1383